VKWVSDIEGATLDGNTDGGKKYFGNMNGIS
jgi:hypothetical protein